MPTVALINGHCYAAAFMLAMAHDYRLAPTPKGYFCLPELTYGLPLTPAMVAIFRHKLHSPTVVRDLTLEASQFTGAQMVEMGVADALAANQEEAWAFIAKKKLVEKAKSGVYGTIKTEVNKELIGELTGEGLVAEEKRFGEAGQRAAESAEKGKAWYEQWKAGKAKL